MEQAARGAAALKASKYAEAVTLYTEAIKQQPNAVNHYIQRSIANQRTSNYHDALADAETAVTLGMERQKRELIAQAQLRRGIALFGLEQYGNAQFVFGIARKLDQKEKSLDIWESKVKDKLQALPEDDEKQKVTVLEIPNKKKSTETPTAANTAAPPKKPAVTTDPSKIRHDWYQNNDNVYVSILAKGVSSDAATITFEPRLLSISFDLPGGSMYDFTVDPLFGPIDPALSKSKILSTKVELVLKKVNTGQKWPALEGHETGSSPTAETSNFFNTSSNVVTTPTQIIAGEDKPPSYPTSSRTGPKNWDKIVSDMSKKPPNTKDKPGSKDGVDAGSEDADATNINDETYVDDDEVEGDEVNAFFKKLYKGADDDTRRAMMKSYQESNGTALSTNWAEVKKGKVETSPPDGMEAKRWGT